MENIKWFGHASFAVSDELNGNRIYFIDPYELPEGVNEKADLVFVTHAHHDHLSLGDIDHILKADTIVVATPDSLDQLKIPDRQKFEVAPNNEYEIKGTKFSTVPAYNTHPEKQSFHPKSNNWVGYILHVNNQKIYHAGDTDFIPEMRNLASKKLDYAMLPIGGTYTMDAEEAILAANAINAKITIPMHYRRLLKEKSLEAEERFKKGVTGSKVLILDELK